MDKLRKHKSTEKRCSNEKFRFLDLKHKIIVWSNLIEVIGFSDLLKRKKIKHDEKGTSMSF